MSSKGYGGEMVAIVIFVVVMIAFIYVVSFYSGGSDPIELDGVEVTEYEGKDLSSINDFRENSIKGPQYIDVDGYELKVGGLVEEEKMYNYDEVVGRQSYSKVVTLDCVEGWSVTILWEGIILRELLAEARPTADANTIIFHAEDGYSTSFPIDYIMERDLLLAYKMNGLALPPERGFPFQLVAEDKWGYKWIKWITEIEFSDDEDYEGFWEQRGYSDSGDLDKSSRK
jgi:DMSO/TMAO reductase YedYZ molybdopterin-dependent catalytic subunit